MLDQLTEEKWPQTIKMTIIWSTAILFVISMFFPVEYVYSNVKKEIGWGHKMIGNEDFNIVLGHATENYHSIFVETGIDGGLREFYRLSPQDIASQGGPLNMIATIFLNMAENLNYWFYMIVYRITLNLYWLPYMAVVIFPSIFAGTMRWLSKRYNFGYASPFLNRRSMVLIGWGIYSILLSLFVPLPVPPMIGAIIMIVMIPIGTSLLIANLPKRI
ncbi:DUF4400 domain-containing protein [Photorhabdus sp. APURE]|uniref:DUF4400 domain-containing protein n=1 Tax=Photorhabdus aballayi TaxID=2991723 RepID=UPI00223CB933|nr:DUF4400 domain-containing protein [Photorhabdus aballayi]MCW7549269.1 DUF4400 domain-containing protein [Photorhabdus aballayi]